MSEMPAAETLDREATGQALAANHLTSGWSEAFHPESDCRSCDVRHSVAVLPGRSKHYDRDVLAPCLALTTLASS
jgi:hypothetical protein